MKTLNREEAKLEMWTYYKANKKSLPAYIVEFREEVIEELMKGINVKSVFDKIINS